MAESSGLPESVNEPARSELNQIYRRRFTNIEDYRRRVWSLLAHDFFQRFIPERSVVLDLGCGWGEFINRIQAKSKLAMDMNTASAVLLDEDVLFLNQDCSTRWPLLDGSLDIVFTSNFFEHLPNKQCLKETLSEAYRCLRTGGRIICLGPNIKYLPGAYWDFWDHYLPLTEQSLKEVLELVGFRIESCFDRFLPYTMANGFTPPIWIVRRYLKMPFLWRWCGKQFLVIGLKP